MAKSDNPFRASNPPPEIIRRAWRARIVPKGATQLPARAATDQSTALSYNFFRQLCTSILSGIADRHKFP